MYQIFQQTSDETVLREHHADPLLAINRAMTIASYLTVNKMAGKVFIVDTDRSMIVWSETIAPEPVDLHIDTIKIGGDYYAGECPYCGQHWRTRYTVTILVDLEGQISLKEKQGSFCVSCKKSN